MEHIERAGVHSGDSFAVYPPVSVSPAEEAVLLDYTQRICAGLRVRGLVNIQYVLFGDEVYVLEVNPRASRTVPFLSKATGVPLVQAGDPRDVRRDSVRPRLRGRPRAVTPLVRGEGARVLYGQALPASIPTSARK